MVHRIHPQQRLNILGTRVVTLIKLVEQSTLRLCSCFCHWLVSEASPYPFPWGGFPAYTDPVARLVACRACSMEHENRVLVEDRIRESCHQVFDSNYLAHVIYGEHGDE